MTEDKPAFRLGDAFRTVATVGIGAGAGALAFIGGEAPGMVSAVIGLAAGVATHCCLLPFANQALARERGQIPSGRHP